jgi:hypothetical protein
MNKACDLIFKIPVGAPGWPSDMFEPLLIGVCFPFLSIKPWEFCGTPKVSFMAQKLHEVRKETEMNRGPLLHKFWMLARWLLSMSDHLVSRVLFFERRGSVPRSPAGGPKRQTGQRQPRPADSKLGEGREKTKTNS